MRQKRSAADCGAGTKGRAGSPRQRRASLERRVIFCALLYAHHFFVSKSPDHCEYLVPTSETAICAPAGWQDAAAPSTGAAAQGDSNLHR